MLSTRGGVDSAAAASKPPGSARSALRYRPHTRSTAFAAAMETAALPVPRCGSEQPETTSLRSPELSVRRAAPVTKNLHKFLPSPTKPDSPGDTKVLPEPSQVSLPGLYGRPIPARAWDRLRVRRLPPRERMSSCGRASRRRRDSAGIKPGSWGASLCENGGKIQQPRGQRTGLRGTREGAEAPAELTGS